MTTDGLDNVRPRFLSRCHASQSRKTSCMCWCRCSEGSEDQRGLSKLCRETKSTVAFMAAIGARAVEVEEGSYISDVLAQRCDGFEIGSGNCGHIALHEAAADGQAENDDVNCARRWGMLIAV